jgi:mRNA interferase YafQ
MDKLKRVVAALVDEAPLDKGYLDHSLKGYFKDRRECHLGPDWLLVYKVNKENKTIIFERTGSHVGFSPPTLISNTPIPSHSLL